MSYRWAATRAALLTLAAHHSFAAESDRNQPLRLMGAITKVDWTNPHVSFYIDVKDDKTGRTANWSFEMAAPAVLTQSGWDGKTISGIINPGPDAMKIENARLDPAPDPNGWKVHFEANAKGVRVVVDAVLEDITSVRRSAKGTWTQGSSKGDFKMRRDN